MTKPDDALIAIPILQVSLWMAVMCLYLGYFQVSRTKKVFIRYDYKKGITSPLYSTERGVFIGGWFLMALGLLLVFMSFCAYRVTLNLSLGLKIFVALVTIANISLTFIYYRNWLWKQKANRT